MNNIFNDNIKAYKNFNMGTEIDIAGTFIYNGIKELDSIEVFNYESEIFTFLYLVSVGIERLQKVLIVLAENISNDKIEEFEKGLITHSHQDLHRMIKGTIDIDFNSRENKFLQVLNNFYKSCRYERFSIKDEYNSEKIILLEYIKENLSNEIIESDFFGNIINTIKVKELLGKVVGAIARTYYNNIYDLASKQNLYTYELRCNSKASKIFLTPVRKNSLQEQLINEQIAFKEFLIFFINTKSKNSFYQFIEQIKPLDLDIELANLHLESICKGNMPDDLVEEVEFWYGENNYSKERIEEVNCIGDCRVDFSYIKILRLREIVEKVISKQYRWEDFIENFSSISLGVENDEILEMLNDIFTVGNQYNESSNNFADKEKEVIDRFKILYKELNIMLEYI